MISDTKLIDELKRLEQTFHKIPSSVIVRSYGKYHVATYKRRFGSWNKALMITFGKIIVTRGPNKSYHNCLVCNSPTKNKYCSHSCATSVTNRIRIRQKKEIKCFCGKTIKKGKLNLCKNCYIKSINKKIDEFGEQTIRDFTSTYARHKYQAIRHHAHRVAKKLQLPKVCVKCGYSVYAELSHIQSIKDFPKNTKLNVVNAPTNLAYLCPTHHWELDHKILQL